MRDELISIIIPVYNTLNYLPECFNSIIKQTYRNIEIIVVDNGSTDGSGKLCDEYASKDTRIKVIHKEHTGVSSARNIGLDAANGKYIGFIDSDDYFAHDMIEQLYSAICESGTKICCCNYLAFSDTKHPDANIRHKHTFEVLDQISAMKLLFSMNHYRFLVWNKIYEKELFDDIRFPDEKHYEDIWPIYNIFKKVKEVTYVRQELCFYRQRNTSLSKEKFNMKEYDLVENIQITVKDCLDNYPDLKDDAAVSYIFYSLSYINKAIKEKQNINQFGLSLQAFIRKHISSLKEVKDIPEKRKYQVYLYALSIKLYSVIYRMISTHSLLQ